MSRKYNNFKTKLAEYQIEMIISEEDFIESVQTQKYPILEVQCKNGHIFKMQTTSMSNKLLALKNGKIEEICDKCIEKISTEEVACIEKCKILGFTFHSFDLKSRNVDYSCVCGNRTTTHVRNIIKESRTPNCPKCQNDSKKKDFETIKKMFSDAGCELLEKKEDYKNKDQPLNFKCVCGSISKITYHRIEKGRLCKNCKQERYVKTCQENWGKDNTFQVEEFKEKSQETCLERYRVEYCQQNPEIREKTEKTCLERYGIKWAFTQDYVYEKIRKIHKEKYGVEFPLQSKKIQEKIDLVFMKNWDAKRPFLSEKFIKKYNQMMLEQYGKEWFVMTDKFKEKMIENYGVEHALQSPILFKKMMNSSFNRKKNYVSEDGKVWSVLGYEDKCIETLLEEGVLSENLCAGEDNEIPVCKYVCSQTGKNRVWYPDVWISDTKRLIEIKSEWTYNKDPIKMKDKMDCCEFNCELWIYNGKKEIIEIILKKDGDYVYLMDNMILGDSIKSEN